MKFDPAEMAMILEQARQEAKKQQRGRKEKKVITWDGDTTGKALVPGNVGYACKISDDPIDLSNLTLKKITVENYDSYGYVSSMEYAGDLIYSSEIPDMGIWGANVIDGPAVLFSGATLIMVVKEDMEALSKGVYLFYQKDGSENYFQESYVSVVEFEKIHPIPQEYIPPLDRLILNGADGNQYALTITDGAISVAPVTT